MLADTEVRIGATDRGSQTGGFELDVETHRRVLVEVAAVIRDHYADKEVAEAIADTIMAYLEQGRADSPTGVDDLVTEVMDVIRSMVADRHFDFSVRVEQKDNSDESLFHERSLHGLRSVQMLENHIAYLVFDGLPGDDASMTAVAQALAEQPEAQAIIFDMRDNIGGSGDMVVLLCSHLLEADTLLYTYSGRSGGASGEMRAAAAARHFGTTIPVFILTSEATLSAAEAFAYILQDFGRAVVVGERTAGMANPSRTFSIGEQFELTVPFLLMRYGRSAGTYAGVGVIPGIEVSPESALDVALKESRRKLRSSGR
jgi:C-terminal processing protease CtpA/Prc